MGLIELLLLGIGLSMDAFAVSICKGIETKKTGFKQVMLCGVWFGIFQGLMPFIGYVLGSGFEFIINKVAPWLAFILLSVIGVNMQREAMAVTFVFSSFGVKVGNAFGTRFRSGAEAAGGFILIFIGL